MLFNDGLWEDDHTYNTELMLRLKNIRKGKSTKGSASPCLKWFTTRRLYSLTTRKHSKLDFFITIFTGFWRCVEICCLLVMYFKYILQHVLFCLTKANYLLHSVMRINVGCLTFLKKEKKGGFGGIFRRTPKTVEHQVGIISASKCSKTVQVLNSVPNFGCCHYGCK